MSPLPTNHQDYTEVISASIINDIATTVNSLFTGTAPGPVLLGTGDTPPIYQNPAPVAHLLRVVEGSAAGPVTTVGPSLKVVRTMAVSSVLPSDGSDQIAAIHAQVEGTATNQVQPVAVMGYARNLAVPIAGNGDSCAIYGVGTIQGGGTGVGIGGFFLGQRISTSLSAKATGLEVDVDNSGTTTDHSFNATGFSQTSGIWMNSIGTNRVGAAISIGNAFGQQFDVGIGFTAQVSGGKTGGIVSAAFRDDSQSSNSILINGTHTVGLNLSGGTMSFAMLIPNGVVISARNAANSGNVVLTFLGGDNRVQLGDANAAGFTIAAPTAGGTIIFNADNKLDIGGGATVFRPRTVYVGTSVVTPLVDTPQLISSGTNVIEQRNGTNSQVLRLYGTTDAGITNYERFDVGWSGTSPGIRYGAGGSGNAGRAFRLNGGGSVIIGDSGADRLTVNAAGLTFTTDNALDIGASGATRPRNMYLGGSVAVKTKAGTPVDADYTGPVDGMLAVDTTANKIWARIGGTWKGVVVA